MVFSRFGEEQAAPDLLSAVARRWRDSDFISRGLKSRVRMNERAGRSAQTRTSAPVTSAPSPVDRGRQSM
jgi:hypothetical protein